MRELLFQNQKGNDIFVLNSYERWIMNTLRLSQTSVRRCKPGPSVPKQDINGDECMLCIWRDKRSLL